MSRKKSSSPSKLPAPEKPGQVKKAWSWQLPQIPIWYGWKHLVAAVSDLESPAIAAKAFRDEDRTVELGTYLEVIWYRQPKLLLIDTRGHLASTPEITGVLDALKAVAPSRRSFALQRRFLEVIDAGNHVGRFRVPIPYVPAPMPSETESPFKHADFEHMIKTLEPLRDAFEASLGQKMDLDPAETWGRILLSATVYGGLTTTASLLALPAAMKNSDTDSELRWLMVTPVNRPVADSLTLTPPRRWFPDPLTRLLLSHARREGMPAMPALSRTNARQVTRLFGSYARRAGFESLLPSGFSDLARAAVTGLHEYMPSWLVAYATNRHTSVSPPDWAWRRMLEPPERVVDELTSRSRHGGGDTPLDADDSSEDDEEEDKTAENSPAESDARMELPAQLRRLGSTVLKGDKNLRQRLTKWRAKEGAALLPSIDLIVQWCTDWLMVAGRGRHPIRRARSLYEKINATGSRIVGQLGGMDLRRFKDPNAYIEVYQTALEDGPSLQVKRKIARGIRSFHTYLVARHGAPALDDDLFRLGGGRGGAVDANLITLDLFDRTKAFLAKELSLPDEAINESLQILADLGYFAGLRRSEAIGLTVGDILGSAQVWLKVRPNELRGLKTRSGRRDLPLFILMPTPLLQRFMVWVRHRWDEEKSFDAPLFPAFIIKGRANYNDHRLHRIVEALRRVADDETLRYHHLRHSFANWLLLRFWIAEEGGKDVLPPWLPENAHSHWLRDSAQAVYQGHFGATPTNRRSLMQVSCHLGHSGADITLHSYFHLADMLLGMAVRRMSPSIDLTALSVLSGLSVSFLESRQSHIRKSGNGETSFAAAMLEDIAGRVLRPHDRRPKTATKVNEVTDLPEICHRAPAEPYARLLHLANAVNQVRRNGDSPNDVALRLGIDESELNRQIERLSRLPPGFLQFQLEKEVIPTERRMAGVDLPYGDSQIMLARNSVELWVRLREKGDPPTLKKHAVAKRLARLAERAPHWWLPGTEITMAFDNLSDAKLWCWWIRKLQLGDGLIGAHLPNMDRTKTTVTANQQRRYWEAGLGISSLPANFDGEKHVKEGTRGSVAIGLDLSLVPADVCTFSRPDALYGMRFVLGMLGEPMSSGVTASDDAPII
jgi:integrase